MKKISFFKYAVLGTLFSFITACSYNPFLTAQENHTTGNMGGAMLGGAAGLGFMSLVHANKALFVVGGVAGTMLGYYLTTLRFAAAGVIKVGGQVYTHGEYLGIELPTDKVFESNTADLLPMGEPALNSIANILAYYPNHNIIISGSMSGFGSNRFEHKLSEDRARVIASYLWAHGISNYRDQSNVGRKLTYVGYGSYFPIASDLARVSLRKNSRIQIVAYPNKSELVPGRNYKNFGNLGEMPDGAIDCRLPHDFHNEFPAPSLPCVPDLEPKDDLSRQAMNYEPQSNSDTNYNSFISSDQTPCDSSDARQGGCSNFKGE